MNPQKPSDDRQLSVPARGQTSSVRPPDREAAAQIMRQQIDQLYQDQTTPRAHNSPQTSPYHQTHSEQAAHDATTADDTHWKHYHSQWQKYYQQYYERYYLAQLNKRSTQ